MTNHPQDPHIVFPLHKSNQMKSNSKIEGWQNIIESTQYIQHNAKQKNMGRCYIILEQLIENIQQKKGFELQQYTVKKPSQQKDYLLYILYYNMSALKSMEKKLPFSFRYLEKAESYLLCAMKNANKPQEKLYLKLEHIRLMIQQCSLLSQMNDHQMAAEYGEKVLDQLVKTINSYLVLFSRLLADLMEDKRNYHNSIDFRLVILKDAQVKLDHLSKINPSSKLHTESTKELQNIAYSFDNLSNQLYSWKANLQNNQKYLLQSLNIRIDSPRNILGVSEAPAELKQFNIGDIMSIRIKVLSRDFYLQQGQICQVDPFYLFSAHKMTDLCILASTTYFTLATEMRLNISQCMGMNRLKFFEFSHEKEFMLCKIMHLKSIEIAGRFLCSSDIYIKHLINSFNKNYKTYMDNISEQQSVIAKSCNQEEQNPQNCASVRAMSRFNKRKRLQSSQKKSKDCFKERSTARNSRSNSVNTKNPIYN